MHCEGASFVFFFFVGNYFLQIRARKIPFSSAFWLLRVQERRTESGKNVPKPPSNRHMDNMHAATHAGLEEKYI